LIRDEPDNVSDEPGLAFDSDFQLRPLLWAQLCNACAPAEHAELRRMLGAAAIEANEALESEVRALLSIASAAQLRHAKAKAREAPASSSSSSAVKVRAALPDSAARQYLAQEVQGLLASLRAQALRSGVLSASAAESPDTSVRRPGSGGVSAASGLSKILPRPETARQQRVLDEMLEGLTRRDSHSAGRTPSLQQRQAGDVGVSVAAVVSSSPGSRPASGDMTGPTTARPSTARQRSLSALASHRSSEDSPRLVDSARDESPGSLAAAAATSLSLSLLSAVPSASGADSARTTLLRALRTALAEEQDALLQDVEYLQACLEIEMDAAVAEEKSHRTVGGRSSSATAGDSEEAAPASVAELRALNDQLKAALQAEQVRSHTLSLMGSNVPSSRGNLASPLLHASPVSSSPSSSFSAAFPGKSPTAGPLKAMRVASASKLSNGTGSRPGSGPNDATAGSRPPSFASRLDALSLGSSQQHAASSASASPLTSPAAADLDLHDLMAANADLFSDGDSAAAFTTTATTASISRDKPVIPALTLGGLLISNGGTVGGADSSPPTSAAASAADGIGFVIQASSRPGSGLPSESPHRPGTARSASKARSRIQAAQQFEEGGELPQ